MISFPLKILLFYVVDGWDLLVEKFILSFNVGHNMNQGLILSIVNQTMYEILVLSVPLLGAAMIVGLVISIFQATTSIQEQTLTFVPKIVIVIIILMVAGPFFMNSMIDFTKNLFNLMATAKL